MNERILHLLRTSPEAGNSAVGGPCDCRRRQAKAARPHPGRDPGHDGSQRMNVTASASMQSPSLALLPIALKPHPMYDRRGKGRAMSSFAIFLWIWFGSGCRGGHHRPCASGGDCRGGAWVVSGADRRGGRLRPGWPGFLSPLCRPARRPRPDLPALSSSHPLGQCPSELSILPLKWFHLGKDL